MLKFLIIVICIYLLLSWLLRPILRMVFQSMFNKMMQQGQSEFQRKEKPKKSQGSINIDFVPDEKPKRRGKSSDQGEYVDYEEVK